MPAILMVVYMCFNPHTYMRCDNAIKAESQSVDVSIHTPT